jgi:hypothetical protein
LLDAIDELVDRYPRPAASSSHYQQPDNGWLAQHDQQYNYQPYAVATEPAFDQQNAVDDNEDVLDPQVIDRAQDLMRERFGLELPEIKRNIDEAGQASPPPPKAREASRGDQVMPQTNVDDRKPPPNDIEIDLANLEGLPPEFLANMPPDISEIVRRNPELVGKMLSETQRRTTRPSPTPPVQQRQQPVEQDRGHLGARWTSEMSGLDIVHEETSELLASDYTNSNDRERDEQDGERTELLRNRRARSSRYKSIE